MSISAEQTNTLQQTPQTKKQMLNYINVFRGFAILAIVAIHTLLFSHNTSFQSAISAELLGSGSVFFVFISGFLFQHLAYKFEYQTYLSKKWNNVICPYLITSIPGIINLMYFCDPADNPYHEFNKGIQVFLFYCTGYYHNLPTWFIPMMAVFFVVAPVLLFLEKKGLLFKSIPLLLLMTLLVQRPDGNSPFIAACSFLHFLSVYVTGMYFAANKDKIDLSNKALFAMSALFVLFSAVSVYNIMADTYIHFSTFSKLVLALIIMALLKRYDNLIQSQTFINKTFDILAKYSFGIFFVHYYINILLDKLFFKKYIMLYAPTGTEINLGIIATVSMRLVTVISLSLLLLFVVKTILLKLNIKNTRMFLGI